MSTNANNWVYGTVTPDPDSHDLPGLKARWILRGLPQSSAPRILDYGSGEGKHLRLIRNARPHALLLGVDIRPPKTAFEFEFRAIEPTGALPCKDEEFDLVVSCDVLEHVDDIETSLREIWRTLKPGGSFVGFVPVEGGFRPHSLFRALYRNIYLDTKDHHHNYRMNELLALLTKRFRAVEFAYSYHFLGGFLDAAFFASFKLPVVGKGIEGHWRGDQSPYYRSEASAGSKSALTRLIRLANTAAYYESLWLHRVRVGACGLHFYLEKSGARDSHRMSSGSTHTRAAGGPTDGHLPFHGIQFSRDSR